MVSLVAQTHIFIYLVAIKDEGSVNWSYSPGRGGGRDGGGARPGGGPVGGGGSEEVGETGGGGFEGGAGMCKPVRGRVSLDAAGV